MIPKHDFIALDQFGEDHWSTMAYMDSVMVDYQGFQVGFDGRMRQCRRNYRVMQEQCPRPRRSRPGMGVAMDIKYSTTVKSGDQVEGHDDWDCVQDMIVAGLVQVLKALGEPSRDVEDMQPGATLTFTEEGWRVANMLRQFKTNGGRWRDFVA